MTIPTELLTKQYSNDYTCRHFVCELWEYLTGEDVTDLIVNENFIKYRHKFKCVDEIPTLGIVRMRKGSQQSHVGIVKSGRLIHLTEQGVFNVNAKRYFDIYNYQSNELRFYVNNII